MLRFVVEFTIEKTRFIASFQCLMAHLAIEKFFQLSQPQERRILISGAI